MRLPSVLRGKNGESASASGPPAESSPAVRFRLLATQCVEASSGGIVALTRLVIVCPQTNRHMFACYHGSPASACLVPVMIEVYPWFERAFALTMLGAGVLS